MAVFGYTIESLGLQLPPGNERFTDHPALLQTIRSLAPAHPGLEHDLDDALRIEANVTAKWLVCENRAGPLHIEALLRLIRRRPGCFGINASHCSSGALACYSRLFDAIADSTVILKEIHTADRPAMLQALSTSTTVRELTIQSLGGREISPGLRNLLQTWVAPLRLHLLSAQCPFDPAEEAIRPVLLDVKCDLDLSLWQTCVPEAWLRLSAAELAKVPLRSIVVSDMNGKPDDAPSGRPIASALAAWLLRLPCLRVSLHRCTIDWKAHLDQRTAPFDWLEAGGDLMLSPELLPFLSNIVTVQYESFRDQSLQVAQWSRVLVEIANRPELLPKLQTLQFRSDDTPISDFEALAKLLRRRSLTTLRLPVRGTQAVNKLLKLVSQSSLTSLSVTAHLKKRPDWALLVHLRGLRACRLEWSLETDDQTCGPLSCDVQRLMHRNDKLRILTGLESLRLDEVIDLIGHSMLVDVRSLYLNSSDIASALRISRKRALTFDSAWQTIAFTMAFLRANRSHALRYSGLALLPDLLRLSDVSGECKVTASEASAHFKSTRAFPADKFIDSRFCQAHLQQPTLPAAATTAPAVRSSVSAAASSSSASQVMLSDSSESPAAAAGRGASKRKLD